MTAAAVVSCAPRASGPTAADAKAFLDNANATTLKLGVESNRAGWVQQTYITDDTETLSAHANQAANDAGARFAKDATRFDGVEVPPDQRRELALLKVGLVVATPSDAKESAELSAIMARVESAYGKGQWCPDSSKPGTCKTIDDVTRLMATSRNETELRAAWAEEPGRLLRRPRQLTSFIRHAAIPIRSRAESGQFRRLQSSGAARFGRIDRSIERS